jgi:hypothetical protein
MVQVRTKRSRPYSLNQEVELEARGTLLARARQRDSKAQVALMALYGARVYSESERKNTTVMGFLARSPRKSSHKS